ncbi:hypothetical protein A5707_16395 [Mycobacterium kyorinense]|uniref:Uncharacterized protein n=1 Tax=Mycobacterium kyorinense TaxID=487514 RepID=A0A1A2ZJC8_9MYCO|nr:hypothetical protein A5707_16395 [Mycobacterium kyorinense]
MQHPTNRQIELGCICATYTSAFSPNIDGANYCVSDFRDVIHVCYPSTRCDWCGVRMITRGEFFERMQSPRLECSRHLADSELSF